MDRRWQQVGASRSGFNATIETLDEFRYDIPDIPIATIAYLSILHIRFHCWQLELENATLAFPKVRFAVAAMIGAPQGIKVEDFDPLQHG